MTGALVFETPRVYARRIDANDVDAMHAVYGDAETVRWVADGTPLDRAQCARWVEVTLGNYAKRGYGMWALVERATGDVVGFCGLVHPDGQPEAEIKYAFRKDQWGRGFATEAATALLAYARETLLIGLVIATVARENAASQRVLLKAGMKRDRLRRNDDGSFTQMFTS